MSMFPVQCPYCGTVKTVGENSTFRCQGCGASVTSGRGGTVKKSNPPRR